ncbi:META domain-containing protein [Vreelandella andesensis]|uniref:META domain-containing protein n=1 Tax=Vreelandella andesensis TaxID=447567 RepID=A0A3S0WCY5_9GAMM|nr:META domain-containing protein [Halomonas andesensis]RUR34942.1 META domain-containing protein [Halomonas andesensis]
MKKLSLIAFTMALLLTSGCQTHSAHYQGKKPDEALTNTYWKLVTLEGQPITNADNFREPHLVLHEENTRLAGSTGCNTLIGSYRIAGKRLTFEQVATTMMACPTPQMRNEQVMLSTLQQIHAWQVDGDTLSLQNANGKPVAVFEAVHLY